MQFAATLANLTDITNSLWSLSYLGYGVIIEGISVIRQRMSIAIRTTKGTDPLRPEFGSNVYKFQDYPENTAIPNIIKELLSCLDIWVKDIKVVAVKSYLKAPGNPVFEIYFRLVNNETIERLIFDLTEGVIESNQLKEIILTAYFPENPNNYRYQISLIKNGSTATPMPVASGFLSIALMFEWVKVNYSYLGKWHLLSDRIICYMDSTGITSASLKIEVLPITFFQAEFPGKSSSEGYGVDFIANGIDAQPLMPYTEIIFNTPGSVLSWVQTNWAAYGSWSIEYLLDDGNSIFSDEFSDEFDSPATGYKLTGVSNVAGFIGELSIKTIQ